MPHGPLKLPGRASRVPDRGVRGVERGLSQAFIGDVFLPFGAPVVSPTGIASAEAVGTPSVEYLQTISPAGIASGGAVGTPVVGTNARAVAIASAEAFGTPRITLALLPSGIASAAAFGTASIRTKLFPSGIASAAAFGTPNLGKFIVGAGGIASQEQIGPKNHFRRGHSIQHTGSGLPWIVEPIELESTEAFGTPLIVGNVVGAGNIASAAAVGSPTVVGLPTVTASGIASAAAFGTAVVALPTAAQFVVPAGIASGGAAGSPTLTQQTPSLVTAVGIASAQAFGGARLLTFTPGVSRPRIPEVIIDLETDETWEFPINRLGESDLSVARNLTHGSPHTAMTAVRQQQGADNSLTFSFQGSILDPAMRAKLVQFFTAGEDHTLLYRDFLGDEYEVVISTFSAPAKHVLVNRITGDPWYWTYTLGLTVIRVRSGAFMELA